MQRCEMVCFFWETVYKHKWNCFVDFNNFEFNKKWNIKWFPNLSPSTPKKILCQINMHYVYHIRHLSIWTLTLNETNRKETFIIWKKLTNWVSGFEHSGHSTKRLIKPSKSDWSLLASWEPLTIKRSFLKSNMVCAPNSHPKNFVGSVIRGKNVQVN